MRRLRTGLLAACVTGASAFGAAPAGALGVTLKPGDILVNASSSAGPQGCCVASVIRVDPVNGSQTLVTSGGLMVYPAGIALSRDEHIFVSDPFASMGPAVLRIDPATGNQTVLSSGGNLAYPFGLAIDADGNVLVADMEGAGGWGAVIRIDSSSGAQETLFSFSLLSGEFVHPHGIAVAPNGDIFLAGETLAGGAVLRVDHATGHQIIVSQGDLLRFTFPITVTAAGEILVGELQLAGNTSAPQGGRGAIVRIDPVSGAQSIVSSGVSSGGSLQGLLRQPRGLALDAGGKILVADDRGGCVDLNGVCQLDSSHPLQAVIQIDSTTGLQTTIASGDQLLGGPTALIVVPPAPMPPTARCRNFKARADETCHADASIDAGSFGAPGDQISLSQSPAGPYPLGSTPVVLTVTDDTNSTSSSCPANVFVFDGTRPTITEMSASPAVLWPPNHKMVNVTVNYIATDNCSPTPPCVLAVTSSEPAKTTDWQIVDSHHVQLRSERSASGKGRVYTVDIVCRDNGGNSASQEVTVNVPHDRGK